MSILDFDDYDIDPPEPEVPNIPVVEPNVEVKPKKKQQYQSAIVDINETLPKNTITLISGASMVGEYYSQLLGIDDAPKHFQLSQADALQQYNLISNFEVKLQGELSYSEVKERGQSIINGTVRIYPTITPNIGDLLVLDTGDERPMAFRVMDKTRLGRFDESAYDLEIRSGWYWEDIKPILERRIINHYYYRRDNYNEGAIILAEDSVDLESLIQFKSTLLQTYFQWFYSGQYKTITFNPEPGKPTSEVYDPFVADVMVNLCDPEDLLPPITLLDCGKPTIEIQTVFDAIMRPDLTSPKQVITETRELSALRMGGNRNYSCILYSGIEKYVWPVVEPNVEELARGKTRWNLMSELSKPLPEEPDKVITERAWDDNQVWEDDELLGGDYVDYEKPLDPNIKYMSESITKCPSDDFYYVLSAAWYQSNDKCKSRLEKLVDAYLGNEVISPKELLNEIKSLLSIWDNFDISKMKEAERFYYHTPIVLMLLNVLTRK